MRKQLLFFITLIISFLLVTNNKTKVAMAGNVMVRAIVLEEISYKKNNDNLQISSNSNHRALLIKLGTKIKQEVLIISEF